MNWGEEAQARLSRVAACSTTIDGVSRLPFSGEHAAALDHIRGWMERAGLEPRRGGIPIMLGTANGTVQAHVATIDSLTFGNVSASGTDAAIAENFGDFNVIGMNVLARLGSWRVEDNTLILVPRAEDTIS